MVPWLKKLQKREMYLATRNVMVAWTIACAIGLIFALSRDMQTLNPYLRYFEKVVDIYYWSFVWTYVAAGLFIIAFVTKPRAAAASNAR